MDEKYLIEAIYIRKIEETFLRLFSEGILNGTVHTCIGEEFSALAFAGQLKQTDIVFSNHRCHGHYCAFTKDYKGLLAELMGYKSGVCAGIGSSQHLHAPNFYSNGLQGGIVPNAAGVALAAKLRGKNDVILVYIGDGTLGEGVVYETLNIASKWNLPLLIVCENNLYAQSTPQSINLAGKILDRALAFGLKTGTGATNNPTKLIEDAYEAINYVRNENKPYFFEVQTYRLMAHSKGDDIRDPQEIERHWKEDPIYRYKENNLEKFNELSLAIENEIKGMIKTIPKEILSIEEYYQKPIRENEVVWEELTFCNEKIIVRLNSYFKEALKDCNSLFIGEDVLSPYGGAFKASNNLSELFPNQVFSTPISEAAIVGIGNGLALAGMKPYVEIMFGDFITLCMDQIVNHSSKYFHMYNKKARCPIVVRTPMGGNRGYGPTHSQTLRQASAWNR